MQIAARWRRRFAPPSVIAIFLGVGHAPVSAVDGEVAYLSPEAQTLVPLGRREIWKMYCREKLTASEEDVLSDLVGSALPEDGSTFNEYAVRIGLLLGQERYYFDNELRLSGPGPGVRILSESARSRLLATLGQVLATNAACDRGSDPRRSAGRDAVPFECNSAPADATPRVQTAEEAITRAKGAWAASGRPAMSMQQIAKFEPYQAVLVNDAWHVYGSLGEGTFGGTPEASICRAGGRTRVWHSQ